MSSREDRPVLTELKLIRKSDAIDGIWGNEESGFVPTLFYLLSNELMVLTLTIPPGGAFRAYGEYRAYFDSHLCLYVLAGQYTYLNPETGEVRTAQQGEMLFLPEKLWHYGNNFGDSDLRVIEIFSPPADASALADVPIPETTKLCDPGALEGLQEQTIQGTNNPRLRNENNAVEALIEGSPYIWTHVYASTERVFLAVTKMLPGQYSGTITAPCEVLYYVEEGEMNIKTETGEGEFHVEPESILFIPANEPHRLFNNSGRRSRILMSGAGSFAAINSKSV